MLWHAEISNISSLLALSRVILVALKIIMRTQTHKEKRERDTSKSIPNSTPIYGAAFNCSLSLCLCVSCLGERELAHWCANSKYVLPPFFQRIDTHIHYIDNAWQWKSESEKWQRTIQVFSLCVNNHWHDKQCIVFSHLMIYGWNNQCCYEANGYTHIQTTW